MLDRDVASVEIPALEGLGCGFGVFVIAFHHAVSAHDDFTLGFTVHRNLGHVFVHDCDVFIDRHGNTLSCLNGCTVVTFQRFPHLFPCAFGRGAIDFGQAINLRDVKAHRLDLGQGRRGRRGACGEYLDRVIEFAAVAFG